MSRLRHIYIKEYPYFVTTNTKNNATVFADKRYAGQLLSCIYYGRENNWYLLLSFVIMPDHLHLVVVPNRKNISQIMKAIKGYSARLINLNNQNKGSLWEDGFYDYILDNEDKLLTKIRYIEENPVRKRLVLAPEFYLYSSANKHNSTDLELYLDEKAAGQECPAYPRGKGQS